MIHFSSLVKIPVQQIIYAVTTGIKSSTRLDTDGSHGREVVKRTDDKGFFRTNEVRAVGGGSKVTHGEQRGWFRPPLPWHRVEAFGGGRGEFLSAPNTTNKL